MLGSPELGLLTKLCCNPNCRDGERASRLPCLLPRQRHPCVFSQASAISTRKNSPPVQKSSCLCQLITIFSSQGGQHVGLGFLGPPTKGIYFFFFSQFLSIEVELICNVVLSSAVQQSDSVTPFF